ncbi:MAG: hypothetical protein K940chlam1_00311 [Candidatus Anoxychlamydiales bacterium]|nr:hypothetical protein [Candidatus Anoxychlamydiales bacterium]NGX36207.1 hypothetical protein [Candidatus Anoxychlamydiales bacterium]
MHCFKCKNKLDLPNKKIGFKEMCPFCEADLHVCKNCKYYLVGKPNDCLVPNTEFVSDREKYNFCEDFSIKENLLDESNNKTKKDISKKLFKDIEEDDENKNFDSLFKD